MLYSGDRIYDTTLGKYIFLQCELTILSLVMLNISFLFPNSGLMNKLSQNLTTTVQVYVRYTVHCTVFNFIFFVLQSTYTISQASVKLMIG